MINATVNKKSTAEKERKEMIGISLNIYPLFGCQEVVAINKDTGKEKKLIAPGTIKQELVEFIKFSRQQLATDPLVQILDKAIYRTNKRDHNMYGSLILGDNKYILLDPVLVKKLKSAMWYYNNIITNPM